MIDDTDILKAVRAQLKAAWPDVDVNLDDVQRSFRLPCFFLRFFELDSPQMVYSRSLKGPALYTLITLPRRTGTLLSSCTRCGSGSGNSSHSVSRLATGSSTSTAFRRKRTGKTQIFSLRLSVFLLRRHRWQRRRSPDHLGIIEQDIELLKE